MLRRVIKLSTTFPMTIMNKVFLLSVLITRLYGMAFGGEQSVYKTIAEDLLQKCEGKNKAIFIGFFPYSGGKDSHDSDIISGNISAEINKLGTISSIGEEVRAEVLARLKIQRIGILDDQTIRKIGKMARADCVVVGNLAAPSDKQIEINARSISVKSGKVLSVSGGILPRDWEQQYWDNIHSLYSLEKSSPNVASLYYGRGKYYLDVQGGRYANAISDFSRALSIDKNYWEAALARGYAYYMSYDYEKARADYTLASEIYETGPDAKYLLGILSGAEGRLEKSIDYFTDVIKMAPNDPAPYKQRGFSYLNALQFDKAIEDLSKSIALAPRQAGAYASRGHAHALKGNYGLAIDDTVEALRLNPSFYLSYLVRGFAYSKLGENDKSEKNYAEAIRVWPAVLKERFYGKSEEEEKLLLIAIFKNYDIGRDANKALLDRLAKYKGDDVVAGAFSEVYRKAEPARKIDILHAFRDLRSSGSLDFLEESLTDTDAAIRHGAVSAIGRIGGDKAVLVLAKMIGDNSPSVRRLAIGLLGVLRAEDYIVEVNEIAKKEKDPEIIWLARQTAEKIQVEKAKHENKQLSEIDLYDLVETFPWRGVQYEKIISEMKALPKEDWPGFIRKIDDFIATFPLSKTDESWEALMFIMPHFFIPFESDPVLAGKLLGDMAADKSYSVVLREMGMGYLKAEALRRIADDPEEYPPIRTAAKKSLMDKK